MRTPHDPTSLLLFTGAVLARDQPQITGHLRCAASTVKSMHVIERRDKRRRRDRTDARTGGQSLDDRIVGDEGRKALRLRPPVPGRGPPSPVARARGSPHWHWEIQARRVASERCRSRHRRSDSPRARDRAQPPRSRGCARPRARAAYSDATAPSAGARIGDARHDKSHGGTPRRAPPHHVDRFSRVGCGAHTSSRNSDRPR